ncbi:MAG: TaqI-like C-terminal specificity domain-containing protein, partial [Anaerolineae bacterium]
AAWDPYDQNAHADFFDPEWMFGVTEGFDIVIGNPPYVRPHKLSAEFKNELWKRFETYEKKADLYVCFIEKGLALLKSDGQFGYIVSNGFLRLDSFELLRKHLLKHATIRQIVDFKDNVFESAVVKTCILLLQNISTPQNVVRVAVVDSVENMDSLPFRSITQNKFSQNYKSIFDLSSESGMDALKDKITQGSVSLGQIFDVSFGLKTGDDEEFLSFQPTTSQHQKLLRGEDVGRYHASFKGEYVWYVPDIMRNHRQTARPGSSDRFEQPKVLVRDTGGNLMGTFDEDNYYVKDMLIISHQSRSPELLLKLIAILNSTLMRFFYDTSFPTLHVQRNELASLPIKHRIIDKECCSDLPVLVRQILTAKATNPAADVRAQEAEIDRLVYALYGLTPAEIRIVEGG